jgi:hypothetical protein
VVIGAALDAANNVIALSATTHSKKNRIAMIERPEFALRDILRRRANLVANRCYRSLTRLRCNAFICILCSIQRTFAIRRPAKRNAPALALLRRFRNEADIFQPTTRAESVENDPQRAFRK